MEKDKVKSRTEEKCPSCGRNFCVLCIPARPSVPQQGQAALSFNEWLKSEGQIAYKNTSTEYWAESYAAYRLAASRSEEATPQPKCDVCMAFSKFTFSEVPAMKSSIKAILEGRWPCTSEAVYDCLTCNAKYLAKKVNERLGAPAAGSTERE